MTATPSSAPGTDTAFDVFGNLVDNVRADAAALFDNGQAATLRDAVEAMVGFQAVNDGIEWPTVKPGLLARTDGSKLPPAALTVKLGSDFPTKVKTASEDEAELRELLIQFITASLEVELGLA